MSKLRERFFEHHFSTMGCPAQVCLYAADRSEASRAFAAVESECRRLDRKYSHYRADSYLAGLLRKASEADGALVDRETAALLNLADTEYQESGGLFDPSVGCLTALWAHRDSLPSDSEISAVLSLTGWDKVEWDGTCIRLPPGVHFDFGGIVKEYAVDRASVLLRSFDIESGYVDLGGDLHILGPHPRGTPWEIGIRNPRGAGAVSRICMHRGGLATSGDYERCSVIDGRRYGHIIDPRSGWPVHGLASVSVVAPSCLLAGAVSTLAMLREACEGLDFLAKSGLSWLAHDGKNVFSSTGSSIPSYGNRHARLNQIRRGAMRGNHEVLISESNQKRSSLADAGQRASSLQAVK